MLESGKMEFIHTKSYEISYALWQVANHVKEKTLADRLFSSAIELVGYAANADHEGMAKVADALQVVIKFAVDVNCISVSNAVTLAKEIGNLQSAIELPAKDKAGDVDISGIFSTQEELPIELPVDDAPEETKFEIFEGLEESGNESGNKAEIRQAAILERIRQTGNCRLGDIQAILPDSSERTIRYDLESLVQRNLVERLGAGGRSVYYRAK